MSQVWKIKDLELEVDMGDAEFLKKYEDAFANMAKTENKLGKTGRASEITIAYCDMFYRLYDDIFGEGTAQKIFNGKKNQTEASVVYDEFLTVVEKSCKEANDARNKLMNRKKQRRQTQKKRYA